jgi:hypothetical protein
MEVIRKHASYANVMATIAVFLALGGAGMAAKALKKNSVGTKQLKGKAVTEAKLADGAATQPKIGSGAVVKGKLADSSVGNGKIEDNAVTGSKIADAQVSLAKAANSLHQNCPTGTTYQQGGCIENSARATQTWDTARTTCSGIGAHLPDTGEMATFFARGGAVSGSGEWTIDLADGTPLYTRFDSTGTVTPFGPASPNPFRCVHQPLS